MPSYVVLGSYTDQGLRNIKEAPSGGYRVEEALELVGGKITAIYLTMGMYDIIFVADAPTDEVMAAALLTITTSGDMHTTTLKAFNAGEMARIINNVRR